MPEKVKSCLKDACLTTVIYATASANTKGMIGDTKCP